MKVRVMTSHQRTKNHSKYEIESAEKGAQAVKLRAAGKSYREIAETLGWSIAVAHKWVNRELQRVPAEDVATLRRQEGERLDRLQDSLWDKAVSGDGESVDRVLKIMDRRSKLFGLDAPQQVEIGVGTVDIAGTARNILAQVTGDVDAEIIDEQDD